ncbi:response regulator [Fodinicola acaciae]|uniref:response regulator n=1 Tax=Fodinicola acaciae TaxID=2681555 RepID=UPI0013CF9893|nr:response regulator transcription factor [Fodinicola acaciae]
MTIRVVIADDHPIVRAGLRDIVHAEDDIDVVAECADGQQAVQTARESRPDVVLMDLRMPRMDGVAATGQITAQRLSRVLILTTYTGDRDVVAAIEAGATGYLVKDAPPNELIDAVRAVARGETVLAQPAAAMLVNKIRTTTFTALSARETEILRHVAAGMSNPAIARHLHIGEATVKTHLLRTFEKLGVNDRTAAVIAAIRHGILPAP